MRWALAVLLLALACDEEPETAQRPSAEEAPTRPVDGPALADRLFVPARLAAAPCDPDAPVPRIERTLTVRVLRGAAVTDRELTRQTQALAAVFAPHGLTFVASAEAEPLAIEELSSADESALGDTADQSRTLARAVGGPVGAFVSRHATGEHPVLVVLRRIAGRRALLRRALPHLRGLTLTPDRREALPMIGAALPARFAPTVFVSLDDIPAGAVDTALAHELGHAAGLDHGHDPHELMGPEPHRCLPAIGAETARALQRL